MKEQETFLAYMLARALADALGQSVPEYVSAAKQVGDSSVEYRARVDSLVCVAKVDGRSYRIIASEFQGEWEAVEIIPDEPAARPLSKKMADCVSAMSLMFLD